MHVCSAFAAPFSRRAARLALPFILLPAVLVTLAAPASAALRKVGEVRLPDACFGMTLEGDRAYVTLHRGLAIVDLSNPTAPALLGQVYLPARSFGVVVSGAYAYVACSDSGLRVVDVSSPGAPQVVGRLALSGTRAIGIRAGTLYISGGGVNVVDVTDPRRPRFVTSVDAGGEPYDLAVPPEGHHMFVAAGPGGFVSLDISAPMDPREAGRLGLSSDAGSMEAVGNRAFLNESFRTDIIDISDPSVPRMIGIWGAEYRLDVAAHGMFLCIAAGSPGLEYVDIATPVLPRLVTRLRMRGAAGVVRVSGDLAVVLDNAAWLQVIDLSFPAGTPVVQHAPGATGGIVALAAAPNPLRHGAELRFDLARRDVVEVVIHGADGRRCRALGSGVREAGPHAVSWDARDDEGRRLPPGMYFLRVSTSTGAMEKKLVLVP